MRRHLLLTLLGLSSLATASPPEQFAPEHGATHVHARRPRGVEGTAVYLVGFRVDTDPAHRDGFTLHELALRLLADDRHEERPQRVAFVAAVPSTKSDALAGLSGLRVALDKSGYESGRNLRGLEGLALHDGERLWSGSWSGQLDAPDLVLPYPLGLSD